MKSRTTENFWLYNIPIAHRGLHSSVVPENSLLAYELAIKNNYTIELDVQMSIDGVLICEHDDNLKRLCNVDKDIRDLTFEEIKDLKLNNTEHKIPTFEEVLKLVDGKTPLVIELKTQKQRGLEEKIVKILNDYKGDFVVQSFNPNIIKKITKLAPNFIVGILTTRENSKLAPKIINYMMHKLWFKYYVKFDFLDMRVQDLEFYKNKVKNYPVICWTCKSEEDIKIAEKYARNIIFEAPIKDLGKFKNNR